METTILQTLTITALITSTSVQTSVLLSCPSVLISSTPSASLSEPLSIIGTASNSGAGPSSEPGSGTGTGSASGPCPGQGYTCDDCLDGWFCPPAQTPAVSAPCGYGWPCYHCDDGWFCVPSPQTIGASRPQASLTPSVIYSNAYPAAGGYEYIGCYQNKPETVIDDVRLMYLASNMANDQCIQFCRSHSYTIAGTRSGTQCFCGNSLPNSVIVNDAQCNMTCGGDTIGSTMCGGPEALSIWSSDNIVQQGQSSGLSSLLATATGLQQIGDLAYTKVQVASSIYTRATKASSASNWSDSLVTSNLSELEMAMLSVIASKANEKQGTAAQNFIGSISVVLNMGMSKIANDVPFANLTSSSMFVTGASSITMTPKHAIALTAVPTEATLYMTEVAGGNVATRTAEAKSSDVGVGAGGTMATLDGAAVDDNEVLRTSGASTIGRKVPRRRAHWV